MQGKKNRFNIKKSSLRLLLQMILLNNSRFQMRSCISCWLPCYQQMFRVFLRPQGHRI